MFRFLKLLIIVTGICLITNCGGGGNGAGGAGPDPDPSLSITSVTPTSGPAGTDVEIEGSGFSNQISGNTVLFNNTEAVIDSASPDVIKTAVPTGAQSGNVSVAVSGDTVSGPSFTVKEEGPTIRSVEPDSSTVGTDLTIEGVNFSSIPSENTVHFDQVTTHPKTASSSELVVTVPRDLPPSDTPYHLSVTVKGEGDTQIVPYKVLPPETISESEAREAVVQAMQDLGYSPKAQPKSTSGAETQASNDPGIFDYVTTGLNKNGDRYVRLLIGPDGNIIPAEDWQQNNSSVCENKIRYMKGAKKWLNFKLFSFTDGYDVFSQFIDVSTGKVEEQREAQGTSLVQSIGEAWNNLQQPIGGPVGPCGKKFPLKIKVTSKVTFSSTVGTDVEKVQSEFGLSYNEQTKSYVGDGKLAWLKMETAGGYPCNLPDSSPTHIKKFQAVHNGTISNVVANLQITNWHKASCSQNGTNFKQVPLFTSFWVVYHSDEVINKIVLDSNEPYISNESVYGLKNWEQVTGDPDIIVRKVYDRTYTSSNGGTGTEKTTIEIIRDYQ